MTASILPFPTKADTERSALITQARANYESIFPTSAPTAAHSPQERNRERIDAIRRRDNFKFRIPEHPVADSADELLMDHVDTGIPCDVAYCAPDSDPA